MIKLFDFVWFKWNNSYLRSRVQLYLAYPKKWDLRPGTGCGTQDLRPRTYHKGETRGPKDRTWDPRPGIHLIVGTQHPKGGPQDQRPWKWISRKFSQFSLKPGDYEWIHMLCVYVFFVYFSLTYHTAYTL